MVVFDRLIKIEAKNLTQVQFTRAYYLANEDLTKGFIVLVILEPFDLSFMHLSTVFNLQCLDSHWDLYYLDLDSFHIDVSEEFSLEDLLKSSKNSPVKVSLPSQKEVLQTLKNHRKSGKYQGDRWEPTGAYCYSTAVGLLVGHPFVGWVITKLLFPEFAVQAFFVTGPFYMELQLSRLKEL